ncbi:MAG TPA: transporter substrate-binding domain-containing protein [Thermoanaerobaculia bacterium]|nr:transporter substrate-binding domain-containing protein [Thermoanaerobaculia bacterium]
MNQNKASRFSGFLLSALLLSPALASAIEIKNVKGDGTCPAGWTPLTFADAVANKGKACGVLAQWDIARLADGGSMDGPGYQCQIRGSDTRTLGNSLCAKRETLEPGKLKVCLYGGFPPFVGLDNGHWSGWDVTYLEQFAKQQGLTFTPVNVAKFDDIWALAGEGQCDIAASGISDLPARRKQTGCAGDWSDHYYKVYRSFAVRIADKDKLKDVSDLKGKTAVVTGGSTADLDLSNRLACANIPQCGKEKNSSCVNVLRTDNEEDSAKMVLNGEAFAYGGGLGSIQYLVEKLGGGKALAVAWTHCNTQRVNGKCQPVSEPFSFVVRHASTGLLEALNRYIASQSYPGKAPDELDCCSAMP